MYMCIYVSMYCEIYSGLSQCKKQKVNILVNQVLNVKRVCIKTLLNTLTKERLVLYTCITEKHHYNIGLSHTTKSLYLFSFAREYLRPREPVVVFKTAALFIFLPTFGG